MLIDGHYYWVLRLNPQDAVRARNQDLVIW
jgi:hypothetical protein